MAGDTLVNTIYGKIPIKELAETYSTIPVYTYKDGEIFISDAIHIRKTQENQELVRVSFDDGTHIDCTPDHRFLTFYWPGPAYGEGTVEVPVEARGLKPKDRIRALRENVTGGGYVAICAGRSFRRKRSRLIVDYMLGRKLTESEHVHHVDHNVSNDHPSNLEYTGSAKEHFAKHPEMAQRMRENNPVKQMTPEWAAKLNASRLGKKRTYEQRLRYRQSKLGALNPNYKGGVRAGQRSRIAEINHKIVSVEPLPNRQDVYCLEVPATGWFFANDVLVKNCQFCSLKDRESTAKQSMDFDFFKSITGQMRKAGVEEIGLFYIGESFMAPKLLVKCIEWCKELGFPYLFLTTNGSLAHPPVVEACMQAGLKSLKFSVNAADEEQFSRYMRSPLKLFRKALENIKSARAIRDRGDYDCGLYASSIKYDGEQGERMQAMLEEHVLPYVDQHYFLPLYGTMAQQTEERAKELGFVPTAGNQGRIGGLVQPLPCWAVFTEGHVRVDGHLSACCFGADDKYDMGSLRDQDFMTAWHSGLYQALRQAHLNKDISQTVCEGCTAY